MHGKVLYATVNDKCYQITSQGSKEVTSRQGQQEEADGRLLLHAAHAAREGYLAVVICSKDTDVFIMSLAYCDKIGVSLLQKYVTRTRTRLVDTVKGAASVGVDVCRALIGMHTYTGLGHCQCACRQREDKRIETLDYQHRNPGHIPTVGSNVESLQIINGQPPLCTRGIIH